jgi:hypothetical protein
VSAFLIKISMYPCNHSSLVSKVCTLHSEHLPPSWVSSWYIHFLWATVANNVPRLIVLLRSNGQRCLVEDPCLIWSSVSGLDDEVSVKSSEVSLFA